MPLWDRWPDGPLKRAHVADVVAREVVAAVYVERGELWSNEFGGLGVQTAGGLHMLAFENGRWERYEYRRGHREILDVDRAPALVRLTEPDDLDLPDEPDLEEQATVTEDYATIARLEKAIRWVIGLNWGLDPKGFAPIEETWDTPDDLGEPLVLGYLYRYGLGGENSEYAVSLELGGADPLGDVEDMDWDELVERVADNLTFNIEVGDPNDEPAQVDLGTASGQPFTSANDLEAGVTRARLPYRLE